MVLYKNDIDREGSIEANEGKGVGTITKNYFAGSMLFVRVPVLQKKLRGNYKFCDMTRTIMFVTPVAITKSKTEAIL